MASLDERITALEIVIAGYDSELKTASDIEMKKMYGGLTKESRVTLNLLLQEKAQSTAGKRRHRMSLSGVVSGIDTPPPPNASNPNVLMPFGLTHQRYDEARRYFNLFKEAIDGVYPNGGYSIGIHEPSGQCVVKGRIAADTFKFPFDPDVIKNHYLCFRLLNDFSNYLAHARRQSGVDNNVGAVTPPSRGYFVLTLKPN